MKIDDFGNEHERKIITMENRIIVVVRGGLVQAIYTNNPHDVDIDVLDYDNMEVEDNPDELQRMANLEKETESLTAIY
ncbi:MAG: hypothetical protein ABFD82_13540 [Syntrophaceae bacterium]